MPKLKTIQPSDLDSNNGPGFPINEYPLRFLAQGDSWFSIGNFPPMANGNLLETLVLAKDAVAVNCARPGAELQHMVDTTRNKTFLQLLNGNKAWRWTALLLSGLGNDVISAAQSGPQHPPANRLLARQEEWGPAGSAERYLSAPGWATFDAHARLVFQQLLAARDKRAVNLGIPVVVHTYDLAVPRPCGSGVSGPWLLPAMQAFDVPQADWPALAKALMQRTRALILDIAASEPTVHVVDTFGLLTPAATTDTGKTLHWQNEIHPSRAGYKRLAQRWASDLNGWF